MNITKQDCLTIANGASLFSTGGGFPFAAQEKIINNLFVDSHDSLNLLSFEELNDSDYICTAYGVGSAENTDAQLSTSFQTAFTKAEEVSRVKISGVFAGETNIEALIFEITKNTGLPIVDADCTGGRAVPEIQFDDVLLAGKSITPIIAVTENGDCHIFQKGNPLSIEKRIRKLTQNGSHSVAIVDHIMQVKDARRILTKNIFTRSLKYGSLLGKNNAYKHVLSMLQSEFKAEILFKGKTSRISLQSSKGFYSGKLEFNNLAGSICEVYVKNENIACTIDGKVVATVPDLITIVSNETGKGIHNTEFSVGEEITIIGIPAQKNWRTRAGKQLFSPYAAGLNIKQKLL